MQRMSCYTFRTFFVETTGRNLLNGYNLGRVYWDTVNETFVFATFILGFFAVYVHFFLAHARRRV